MEPERWRIQRFPKRVRCNARPRPEQVGSLFKNANPETSFLAIHSERVKRRRNIGCVGYWQREEIQAVRKPAGHVKYSGSARRSSTWRECRIDKV